FLFGRRSSTHAREAEAPDLRTERAVLVCQIDVEPDDAVTCPAARCVPYPRDHLSTSWRDDADRVERHGRSLIAGVVSTVDEGDAGLQRGVDHARMETVAFTRVLNCARKPQRHN